MNSPTTSLPTISFGRLHQIQKPILYKDGPKLSKRSMIHGTVKSHLSPINHLVLNSSWFLLVYSIPL